MNKDVVYVDIEDDITDIVGKVKASKEQIVALVPPKRMGALQSTVNLKLLVKMAKKAKKHVVLISNSQALIALAGVAKIPVAKTLQSRPEIPEITALKIEDDSDVIVGDEVAVGEFAKVGDKVEVHKASKKEKDDDIVEEISLEESDTELEKSEKPRTRKKKAKNVPDFNSFRVKLFVFGVLACATIGFVVWATVFAPAATIVVTAKTDKINWEKGVTFVTDLAKSDELRGKLFIDKFEITKTEEVEFTPTGQKDVGDKATGTMDLGNCSYFGGVTVSAGTKFTADSLTYVSTADVFVPAPSGSMFSCTPGVATVSVEAEKVGEDYNVAARSYDSSVAGLSADGSEMTGGTKRTIKIVSEDDVKKAKEQLAIDTADNAGRDELFQKFKSGLMPITSSFEVSSKDPEVSPKVGEEVKLDKAKLTAKTTYSAYGVDRAQVEAYVNAQLAETIKSEANRKIYNNGVKDMWVDGYMAQKGSITGTLKTNSVEVGPEISEDYIREVAKGNRYGEVKRRIESVNGVRDVDIRFSYFWVQRVPKDDSKLKVEFILGE